MAIKFFNIRSGEVRVAENEPHITAMLESSNYSTNITQGQDFGWRLAPEVVAEMNEIKNQPDTLLRISMLSSRPLEDIKDSDILSYISSKTSPDQAPVASKNDYAVEYDEEVRAAEMARQKREHDKAEAAGDDDDNEPTTTKRQPSSVK